MRMYAVTKGNSYRKIGMIIALFCRRGDAENYIKERMIESIPGGLLDLNKSETVEIERDFYIHPMEVKIGEDE